MSTDWFPSTSSDPFPAALHMHSSSFQEGCDWLAESPAIYSPGGMAQDCSLHRPWKERELLLLPAALLGSTKGDWSKAGQYKHNKALEKVQVAVGA